MCVVGILEGDLFPHRMGPTGIGSLAGTSWFEEGRVEGTFDFSLDDPYRLK